MPFATHSNGRSKSRAWVGAIILHLLGLPVSQARRDSFGRVELGTNCPAFLAYSQKSPTQFTSNLTPEASDLAPLLGRSTTSTAKLSLLFALDSQWTVGSATPTHRRNADTACIDNWLPTADGKTEICYLSIGSFRPRQNASPVEAEGLEGMSLLDTRGLLQFNSKTVNAAKCLAKAVQTAKEDSRVKMTSIDLMGMSLTAATRGTPTSFELQYFPGTKDAAMARTVDDEAIPAPLLRISRPKVPFPARASLSSEERMLIDPDVKFDLIFESPNDAPRLLHTLPILRLLDQSLLDEIVAAKSVSFRSLLKDFGIGLTALSGSLPDEVVDEVQKPELKMHLYSNVPRGGVFNKLPIADFKPIFQGFELDKKKQTTPLVVVPQALVIGDLAKSFPVPDGVLHLSQKAADSLLNRNPIVSGEPEIAPKPGEETLTWLERVSNNYFASTGEPLTFEFDTGYWESHVAPYKESLFHGSIRFQTFPSKFQNTVFVTNRADRFKSVIDKKKPTLYALYDFSVHPPTDKTIPITEYLTTEAKVPSTPEKEKLATLSMQGLLDATLSTGAIAKKLVDGGMTQYIKHPNLRARFCPKIDRVLDEWKKLGVKIDPPIAATNYSVKDHSHLKVVSFENTSTDVVGSLSVELPPNQEGHLTFYPYASRCVKPQAAADTGAHLTGGAVKHRFIGASHYRKTLQPQ